MSFITRSRQQSLAWLVFFVIVVDLIGFGIVSAIFGFVLSRRCSTRQHTSTPVPASRVIAQSAELSAINVRTAKDQV